MDYKYYIVIRETLGQVIVCITRGFNPEYAYQIVTSSFKDCTGRYLTLEITKKDYDKYSYNNFSTIGKFKYHLPNDIPMPHLILEGEETVYVLVTGSLANSRTYFK